MKIFIIYASAGFGHKKIAEAVNETAVSLFRNDCVCFIDVLDFSSPAFKFLYSKGYIFFISRLKWLWAFLFFLTDAQYLKLYNDDFRFFSNRFFCLKFIDFIIVEQPDFIISTHFLVNLLISHLKEKNIIKTKLISIITDFGVHNFWLAKNVDTYIVASNQTKDILISKQVDAAKIKVLGMPTRRQFQKEMDSKSIREKIGIKNQGFTVLILTGGIGIGPIYEIVRLLNDKINVIVICGNNKKLYYRLKGLGYKNLVILGWIDYVEEAMKVSNIVITKPGGSTVAECLTMGLPMIFFSIIPGQEFQNAKILFENGLAFIINDPKKIEEKIIYLKDNSEELQKIKDKIEAFRLKDTELKILGLIPFLEIPESLDRG